MVPAMTTTCTHHLVHLHLVHLHLLRPTRCRVEPPADCPRRPGQGPNLGRGGGRADRSRPDHRRHPAGCVARRFRRRDPAAPRRVGAPRRARRSVADPASPSGPDQPVARLPRRVPGPRRGRTRRGRCLAGCALVRHRPSPPPRGRLVDLRRRVPDVPQAVAPQVRRATSSGRPHRFAWMVDDEPRVSAFEELAEVVHDARQAGVASEDLDLIRQLVRTGSPQLVAQQRNVTARTIRNHRARAIEHIRAALDPAA